VTIRTAHRPSDRRSRNRQIQQSQVYGCQFHLELTVAQDWLREADALDQVCREFASNAGCVARVIMRNGGRQE
jgi:GMP synthase-like glutamine amidotransferase